MTKSIFLFPGKFFFCLFAICIFCLGIERLMAEQYNSDFMYRDSIKFFSKSTDLIAIIGVIVTIISLAPLFLTFILGDDWFHILLASQIGIQTLGAIIFATMFAAFFIYSMIGLLVFRWKNQIFQNEDVRPSEKIITFSILFLGVGTIVCSVLFLLYSWFTRINPVVSITGLLVLPIGISFLSIIAIAVLIDLNSRNPYSIKIVFSVVIMLLLFAVIGTTIYPTVKEGINVYKIASNYTVLNHYNLSFQNVTISSNSTPVVVSFRPNTTDFLTDDVNIDYFDCHWSTNYGYFFTIDSDSGFIQNRMNEFIIPKCLQPPNYRVFWTYDISDLSKTKPPFIVSLRIENSNKKAVNEKLRERMEYVVNSTHQNFKWIGVDSILVEDKDVF